MYKVQTGNKQFEISVDASGLNFTLNSKAKNIQVNRLSARAYLVRQDEKEYFIELLEQDNLKKNLLLKINQKRVKVKLEDHLDALLKTIGVDFSKSSKISNLKAPMPGLVVDVLCKVGQQVKKDDQLLVLEAMKMENVIKSSGEGTVQNIRIKQGNTVDKGEVLITFN